MRPILLSLCTAAAVAAFAAPAAAQDVEELTITARLPDGRPAELSEVVSIADLDLTTRAGQDAMTARVRKVASGLCERLGETGEGPPVSTTVRNCEDDAVARTRSQMNVAIANARSGPALAAAPLPPEPAPVPPPAPSANAAAAPASATFTSTTVTNGPVPDTAENRARYGQPMSRAGKMTAARGN